MTDPAFSPLAPTNTSTSGGPTASQDRYQYGTLADVGWFSRLLWYCAGADAQLLVRCPNSDRVKFQGLGGVVLTVGVLAFFSGSYAFYTVFSPKDATALGGSGIHWPSVGTAIFFGLVWALVIFNIDRFIVSSTSKGDGTDKITWAKLANASPRIIMALIIGVCLSKPLEIKILESEVKSELEKMQKQRLAELNDASELLVANERTRIREKIDELQRRIDDGDHALEVRRLEIQQQRKNLELEAEGKTASGSAGRGPAWRDKRDNLDRMEQELDRDREALTKKSGLVNDELKEAKAALAALDDKLTADKASNLQVARHLDGLMMRIQVSHKIGGLIPLAIMLLLLAIETGPIFFKLMLTKGSYDYLEENQKRIVRAKAGIEPDARVVSDGQGKSIHIDLHHGVNAVLAEERRRLETERMLAEAVHEAVRKKTSAAIEANPEAFLRQP